MPGRPAGGVATYDELKQHGGRTYSGMKVGRTHVWDYPDGRWRERKVTPDLWQFNFASSKSRKGRGAPEGSGVPVDTEYHWFIQAHQFVRKLDANTYETYMEGLKHKLAHRRATAHTWSTGSSKQRTEQARLIAVLEETLENLRAGQEEPEEEARPRVRSARRAKVPA